MARESASKTAVGIPGDGERNLSGEGQIRRGCVLTSAVTYIYALGYDHAQTALVVFSERDDPSVMTPGVTTTWGPPFVFPLFPIPCFLKDDDRIIRESGEKRCRERTSTIRSGLK